MKMDLNRVKTWNKLKRRTDSIRLYWAEQWPLFEMKKTRMCELCGYAIMIIKITKHHLIPISEGTDNRTAFFCKSCQKRVHKVFTNKELARRYNTVAALLRHPKIKEYIDRKNSHSTKVSAPILYVEDSSSILDGSIAPVA